MVYYGAMDSPLFFGALFVHLISLVIGFGSVFVIDTFGILYLAKKISLLQVVKVARVTQRLIWVGWTGLVASGIPMLLMKGSLDNLTLLKLFFVALLGVNGLLLHATKRGFERALARGGKVSPRYEFRIGFATVISQIGWWSAVIIGFTHRHISHHIPWPSSPLLWIGIITLMATATFLYGDTLLRKKRR